MVAMNAETGRELWRFRAGVIESPPLLRDGVLYFGSWDRKFYALDAKTHRVRWTFETGDKIKGGAAFANGTLYFGSYDGKVYALDARTGKLRWSRRAAPRNFYATPAVAYGRVYIGNTDGRVYAFGAKSGDLLWARSTGDFVYSSAAVWNRTVYVGSLRRQLLCARRGDGRRALVVRRRRRDLGRGRPSCRERLLLDPRARHVRARRPYRQEALAVPRRQVHAARRRRGAGLPRRATSGSTASGRRDERR